MSALFPDVPFTQGVPAVLRDAATNYSAQSLLVPGDDTASSSSNDWGIFNAGGERVLEPDSVVAFERGVEYRISDYPIERGGFQSYNKVATPFEVRLTLTKSGSVADRQAFLNAVDDIQASLDVYDVATPEKVYVGVNVTRVSQSRTAQSGANMATVELLLQEVRQTVTVAYSTVASDTPPPLAAAPAQASASQPATPKLTKGTTKFATAVATVNQGGVQAKPVTISGASLVTSTSGKQLYVYNKPIGKVR
jgi:hypothetical protein